MAQGKKTAKAATATGFGMPSLDDLTAMMEQFKLPGVDLGALVEWQRKDLEALAEANREAYEGYKALLERRNEILQTTLADWQEHMQGATGADALQRQSEAVRNGIQKAVDNFRELSEIEAEARNRAWKVVQKRMQENMENLQQLLRPVK